jgi:phosphoglucosamine mutase
MLPQVLVNVRTATKVDFAKNADVMSAVALAEKQLGDRGRVLLRASGTEPVIRVMVEGDERAEVTALANRIADVVKKAA